MFKNEIDLGNSVAVHWLGLCAFTAGAPGSIPGCGNKILKASWSSQKKKEIDLYGLIVTASSEGNRPGKAGAGVFEFEEKGHIHI